MVQIDKNYCMSSYLSFRYVDQEEIVFKEGLLHPYYLDSESVEFWFNTVGELDQALRFLVDQYADSSTAILLSSGIDSAILASYLKPGSKAYTLRCAVPGAIDETEVARRYADRYDLDWECIDCTWDDYLAYTPPLMRNQGMPIHSIGPQIYKALLHARSHGFQKVLSGYGADCLFGGLDRILSKEWTLDEFCRWYTFVAPERILKQPVSMVPSFSRYLKNDGFIDTNKFIHSGILGQEGATSFNNPFLLSGIENVKIYPRVSCRKPLDLTRIRNGKPKYQLRKLFMHRYPGMPLPDKISFPRAMEQWLIDWRGPTRDEFLSGCISGLTGEQKWLVFCLEMFLEELQIGV